MKFKVENNWLLRSIEEIELNPERFLHCSDIEELNNEICDYINKMINFPEMKNGVEHIECLGTNYWDTTYGNFMLEWQRLKGLPAEL